MFERSFSLWGFATIAVRTLIVKSSNMKNPENYKEAKSIYEFNARNIKGEEVSLERYKGYVCIIVNVASQCGYAKTNYAELIELHKQYADTKGLRILAFPCNQFSNQEPGDNKEICEFCKIQKVNFDMFEKIDVNGSEAHPLWKYLTYKQGGLFGSNVKWNFTKFIIDKNGQPVERHGPNSSPLSLVDSLKKYW